MTGATVLASPTPEPFRIAHRCKWSRNKSRFVSLAGWKGASSCILQQGAPQGRTNILCDDERTLGRGWGCAQLSTLLVWYKINRTNWSWSTSVAVELQEPRRTTSEVVETLVYVWLWYPTSTRQTAWKCRCTAKKALWSLQILRVCRRKRQCTSAEKIWMWMMDRMSNEVVYRQWESDRADEIAWQLAVLVTLRDDLLRQLHNSKTAGHLGIHKTLAKVSRLFYWRGCGADVKRWCRNCNTRASRNQPHAKQRAENLQSGCTPTEDCYSCSWTAAGVTMAWCHRCDSQMDIMNIPWL